MNLERAEERQLLKDLLALFVRTELMPLGGAVLEEEAMGEGRSLSRLERARVRRPGVFRGR